MLIQKILDERLLQGIFWSFTGKRFDSQEDFQKKLKEYAIEMGKVINPAIAFDQPEITIFYEEFSRGKNKEFTLKADNGESFTITELLFKIHNHMVKRLRRRDHHFFQGLTLLEKTEGKPPVYVLNVGS